MKKIEILTVFIASILTLILSYNWNTLDILGKIAIIFGIISSLIVAINSYKNTNKEKLIEKINAKYGDLKSVKTKSQIMMLGNNDNGPSLILSNGLLNFKPFGTLLKLNIENEKLILNVLIRNLNGKVIAVIKDNTWTIFDSEFEYNNSETTFELVTNGERKVFFQIDYRNAKAYVSGYLINDKAIGMIIYNDTNNLNSSSIFTVTPKNKSDIPTDLNIPRIFKYPREKYYGVKI